MPPRKKKSKPTAQSIPSLEDAIDELSAIVHELEAGQQPLDASLEKFERGITLMKQCDRQLQAAAGRIEQLQALSPDGDEDVVSFDAKATATRTRDGDASDDELSGSLF